MTTATNNNVHDISAGKKTDTSKKTITNWGAFWRIGGVLLIFAAAVAAIAFGMWFGIGYIVSLGLGAEATLALKILIGLVGSLTSLFLAWKTQGVISNIFGRRVSAGAEEAAAGAELAAAAA